MIPMYTVMETFRVVDLEAHGSTALYVPADVGCRVPVMELITQHTPDSQPSKPGWTVRCEPSHGS